MNKTHKIVMAGVMAALVTAGTMLVQIPTPTKGYIHIGDSLVYLAGILLGPVFGGAASAIGSMMADLLSGYAVYAPATFVIKGLDAIVIGVIYMMLTRKNSSFAMKSVAYCIGFLAGGVVMVGGYYLYEAFLNSGNFAAAAPGIIPNIIQAVGGGLLGYPVFATLTKVNFIERLNLSN